MKVSIISSTPDAANLLLFTKSTRLNMSPDLMDDIRSWDEDKRAAELLYMSKTIKSSWEFIDIVFLFEGVSRACAQQITRTRTASYAMQSQRVTDVREFGVVNPFPNSKELETTFYSAVDASLYVYGKLIDGGAKLEDARGVLPMNSMCNLVAKYNLRSLTDLLKARQSLRAQGEYRELTRLMLQETISLWPWVAPFFESDHKIAIEMLEKVATELGITTGKGPAWEIAKAIDLLRKD